MGIHFGDIGTTGSVRLQESSRIGHLPGVEQSFHFWHGASGQRYVHTAYSLIDCPQLPACTYVLVRRTAEGECIAMRIGSLDEAAPSLNLAHVRHRAARLGASEVHVHLLAGTADERDRVEADLQAGQFAELASEPMARPSRLC